MAGKRPGINVRVTCPERGEEQLRNSELPQMEGEQADAWKEVVAALQAQLENGFETITMSTGAANIYALQDSINSLLNDYEKVNVVVMPHRDCGMMKAVQLNLSKEDAFGGALTKWITNQFKGRADPKDLQQLEKANQAVQQENLRTRFDGQKVSGTVPAPIPVYRIETGDVHTLLVGKPAKLGEDADLIAQLNASGSEPHRDVRETYTLRAFFIEELEHNLPVFLNKKNIVDGKNKGGMGIRDVLIQPAGDKAFESRALELVKSLAPDAKVTLLKEAAPTPAPRRSAVAR